MAKKDEMDRERETPSPTPDYLISAKPQPHGPNTQGNERDSLVQDPEGQQAGTEGGSKHPGPLASRRQRETGRER